MDTLNAIFSVIGEGAVEEAFNATQEVLDYLVNDKEELNPLQLALVSAALAGAAVGTILEETGDLDSATGALATFYSAITDSAMASIAEALEVLNGESEGFLGEIKEIFNTDNGAQDEE